MFSVSVPLRGSGDERIIQAKIKDSASDVFQSPCGEVVMKAEIPTWAVTIEHLVSVPLRGSGDERSLFLQ